MGRCRSGLSIGLRRVRRRLGMARLRLTFFELRAALEAGTLRAAEPDASLPLGWRVNAWVKRGILLGFRLGRMGEMGSRGGAFVLWISRLFRRGGLRWRMGFGWCRAGERADGSLCS